MPTPFSAGVEVDARIPAYFDGFLRAVARGARIDHVHLGHWDAPAEAVVDADTFAVAQHRLAEHLVVLADLRPGQRVLDVGCGLGGLARLIDRQVTPLSFVGLNIDPRQIRICRGIDARASNALAWVVADACRLPFADAAFDRLFCIEAMFHFASRRRFLAEARRVLKPGGRLVLSDILVEPLPPGMSLTAGDAETCLRRDLGPWPDVWCSRAALRALATAVGLTLRAETDATANTQPSYELIAPASGNGPSGTTIMRRLHEGGALHYVYMALDRELSDATGEAA